MYSLIKIREFFKAKFNQLPTVIVRAPGRVNIIGEHTDYNGGLVFPFCIEQSIYVQMARNDGDNHRLFSHNLNDFIEISIKQDKKTNNHWINCFIGALKQVDVFPAPNSGFDVLISGDLPFGKGLSSSSALCCGFVAALAELENKTVSKLEIAKMAYKVEHDFIGIPCGFMDQFTIAHGEQGKAIFLNCVTEEFELVDLPDVHFVLIDSGVERELHNSAYAERRNTCNRILKKANNAGLPIKNISEIEKEEFEDLRYILTLNEIKRLQYVLSENQRVEKARSINNAEELGQLLNVGMQGLREKYEVSCKEIDVLTHLLNANENVFGARMVGGGFGGAVLVVARENVDLTSTLKAYQKKTGLQAEEIAVTPANGLTVH